LAVSETPPEAAVIVATEVAETPGVVMLKLADDAPAGTDTEPGTLAEGLLETKLIVAPPLGAFLASETVPVAPFPPTTEVGETVNPESNGVKTVSVAVCVELPKVAVMVAVAVEVTEEVVTVNVPVVLPAGTVTVPGTTALELFEPKPTETPAPGAGPFKVTVPVEVIPPVTDLGESPRLMSAAGVMLRVAVCVLEPRVPVTVAITAVVTPEVVIENVTELAPDGIVTDAGTVALNVLEVKLTTAPPVPAGPVSVAVPVAELPPISDVGEIEMALSAAGLIVRVAFFDRAP